MSFVDFAKYMNMEKCYQAVIEAKGCHTKWYLYEQCSRILFRHSCSGTVKTDDESDRSCPDLLLRHEKLKACKIFV
jgi:hypothetical protein